MENSFRDLLLGLRTSILRPRRRKHGSPSWLSATESLECRLLLSAESTLLSPAVDAHDSATQSSDNQSDAAIVQDAAAASQSAAATADAEALALMGIELCAPPEIPPPVQAATSAALEYPLADTFKLHSNAGAPKQIYLDFDGNTTVGTDWNTAFTNGAPIVTPAFSQDNDPAFSSEELITIQRIFDRVSEDFIGFDVDVTTENPGPPSLLNSHWGVRVVIGGDWSDWYVAPAGGVAYLNSFMADSDTPAFVFSETDFNDEKYTAEAISHEVGHTLGLSHDGRTSPSEEYYLGQGDGETGWAPIMGAGYYKNVTQWSKGEYANANNHEDDLAIITSRNGFGYRADDFPTEPTPLVFNAGVATVHGILETGGDTTEGFSFSTSGGVVDIDVIPFSVGPGNDGANNDMAFSVVDLSNNSIVKSVSQANALEVHAQINLPAGSYVVRVSSVNNGNAALDGYSDYASMGRYTLTVSYNGPEIDVTGNGLPIDDGDTTPIANEGTAFGSTSVVGGTVAHSFTIANIGSGPLNLTGTPRVQLTGLNPGDFTVSAQPAASVAAGGSTTFTIVFDPTAGGLRTAIVNIANNDNDENPYNFTISGTGTIQGPEIDIQRGGVSIADDDTSPSSTDGTAFGGQAVSIGSVTRTFTIANLGTQPLNLTGTPRVQISGLNASDFTVTAQPAAAVAAGGTTTFTIAFDPSAAGLRTAVVNIANNDSDENPYNFTISGTGTIQAPEMDVQRGGVSIADDDISPSSTDGTAFGTQAVSIGSVSRTFTIANLGTLVLNLTGTPRVEIGGLNASDFTVTAQPAATVAGGGTTTFTIAFDPSAAGLRTATVTIANNDSDENPYNFTISGTGTVVGPEIDVRGNNVSIADGDTSSSSTDGTAFGSQSVSSGSVTRTFTIANTGTAALNLTGTPRVQMSGVNATDFTVTAQPAASVAAGGTTTFTIVFDPTASGLRTAMVNIINNDSDENPYNFTISGTGTGGAAVPNNSLVAAGMLPITGPTNTAPAIVANDGGTTASTSPTATNSGQTKVVAASSTTNQRSGVGASQKSGAKQSNSTAGAGGNVALVQSTDAVFADPAFGDIFDTTTAGSGKPRSRRHGR